MPTIPRETLIKVREFDIEHLKLFPPAEKQLSSLTVNYNVNSTKMSPLKMT
jgi:hypothetical protein